MPSPGGLAEGLQGLGRGPVLVNSHASKADSAFAQASTQVKLWIQSTMQQSRQRCSRPTAWLVFGLCRGIERQSQPRP